MKFCSKHPYIIASARCFHCKKDICKDCRLNLAHHIFCSKKCYYLYQISKVLLFVKKHRVKVFIGWNTLLTVLLFSFIFIRPQEISPVPESQKSDISAKSALLSYGLPFSTLRDSLISPGRKIRSKILNEKI
ncbi:MAG: hypothetical protein ACE5GL_12235, partial [Calditrichia bacterium]